MVANRLGTSITSLRESEVQPEEQRPVSTAAERKRIDLARLHALCHDAARMRAEACALSDSDSDTDSDSEDEVVITVTFVGRRVIENGDDVSLAPEDERFTIPLSSFVEAEEDDKIGSSDVILTFQGNLKILTTAAVLRNIERLLKH